MKTIILMLSAVLFSSCMHVAMTEMSGHGDHDGLADQAALEKEVVAGNIKATAFFPVMRKGVATVFTLRLSDASTLQPLTGAEVYGHFTYFHRASEDSLMGADHDQMIRDGADSTLANDSHHGMNTERKQSDHEISMHLEAIEGKDPGTYTFSATPPVTGEYTIAFHFASVAGQQVVPQFLIETRRKVTDTEAHDHGGMMGMGGASQYWIIGGVLMGTMMVVTWFIRGGVHW